MSNVVQPPGCPGVRNGVCGSGKLSLHGNSGLCKNCYMKRHFDTKQAEQDPRCADCGVKISAQSKSKRCHAHANIQKGIDIQAKKKLANKAAPLPLPANYSQSGYQNPGVLNLPSGFSPGPLHGQQTQPHPQYPGSDTLNAHTASYVGHVSPMYSGSIQGQVAASSSPQGRFSPVATNYGQSFQHTLVPQHGNFMTPGYVPPASSPSGFSPGPLHGQQTQPHPQYPGSDTLTAPMASYVGPGSPMYSGPFQGQIAASSSTQGRFPPVATNYGQSFQHQHVNFPAGHVPHAVAAQAQTPSFPQYGWNGATHQILSQSQAQGPWYSQPAHSSMQHNPIDASAGQTIYAQPQSNYDSTHAATGQSNFHSNVPATSSLSGSQAAMSSNFQSLQNRYDQLRINDTGSSQGQSQSGAAIPTMSPPQSQSGASGSYANFSYGDGSGNFQYGYGPAHPGSGNNM